MKYILPTLIFIIIPVAAVFAQVGGGPQPLANPVPVDGGALALLGARAAYGYKKIRDKRKSKSDDL
jgi:membrane protein implicated in regulation of membrane protease activity